VSKILPARSAECTSASEYASEFDLICANAIHFYACVCFPRALPLLASVGSGTLRLRRLGVAEAACVDFRYFSKSRSLLNTYHVVHHVVRACVNEGWVFDLPEQPSFPQAESSA
jgi:hypothetical protein